MSEATALPTAPQPRPGVVEDKLLVSWGLESNLAQDLPVLFGHGRDQPTEINKSGVLLEPSRFDKLRLEPSTSTSTSLTMLQPSCRRSRRRRRHRRRRRRHERQHSLVTQSCASIFDEGLRLTALMEF